VTVGPLIFNFVAVEKWTREGFFSLVAFTELVSSIVVCDVLGIGAGGATTEFIVMAGGLTWLSGSDMDIDVWLHKISPCSEGVPGPTVEV
jgi:hypothetical protein